MDKLVLHLGMNSMISHDFVEIDHEIISTVITYPSADPRRVVVSYKRKYVHGVLVRLSWKKSGSVKLTVST